MQYPFGSPLTDSVVVGFQVLQSMYNDCLSILPENFNGNGKGKALHERISSYLPNYNTTQTLAQLKPYIDNTSTLTSNNWSSYVNTTKFTTASQPSTTTAAAPYYTFADTWYRGTAYNESIKDIPLKAAELYQNITKQLLGTTFTEGSPYLEYHGGLYSSIWLSAGRSYFETKGTYTDITYNPFTDRGQGNMVWIDWVSKHDSVYSKTQSKCLIENLPLWASVYGYAEYCSKSTGDTNIEQNCRVVIRSPFTNPQLLDHNNPLRGYVPYSVNFGNGKMPGGSSQVPIRMRSKWYPTLFHQKEVLEAIAQAGPFAYHSDQMKVSLGMKYAFKWVWGGNPVSQQVVRNPCKDTGGSSGNRVPRSVQIVDPKYNTPELAIHAWDFRRGLFGPKAIKRMQTEPYPTELLSPGRKRYRRDTEALLPSQEEQQKENLFFLPIKQLRPIPPWEESDQTQSEEEGVQQETQTLSQQLQQQLKEQQLMGVQLRALYQQLQRVQQNTHIDPTFLPRGAGVTSLFQTA